MRRPNIRESSAMTRCGWMRAKLSKRILSRSSSGEQPFTVSILMSAKYHSPSFGARTRPPTGSRCGG